MPYPLRMTVFPFPNQGTFHARPTEGAKLFRSLPLRLVIYPASNEISCSLLAPKDEKWRTSSVAAYCRATRRSRVALNFWRAVDPANEIDQSTLSEPRIVSAGVRFPDAGMNA